VKYVETALTNVPHVVLDSLLMVMELLLTNVKLANQPCQDVLYVIAQQSVLPVLTTPPSSMRHPLNVSHVAPHPLFSLLVRPVDLLMATSLT
jgi:hypothetical protein